MHASRNLQFLTSLAAGSRSQPACTARQPSGSSDTAVLPVPGLAALPGAWRERLLASNASATGPCAAHARRRRPRASSTEQARHQVVNLACYACHLLVGGGGQAAALGRRLAGTENPAGAGAPAAASSVAHTGTAPRQPTGVRRTSVSIDRTGTVTG